MDTKKLDKYMEEMPKRGLPFSELAVAYKGKIVYRKAVGQEDDKNIYFVCSISKITTCVAAMRLVEEGKIGLDDPVEKYLPAYKNLLVKQKDGSIKPAKNKLTIRHLFTMTGGLNYNLQTAPILRALQNNKKNTIDIVNAFAESPLDFEPGERFQYSLCHDVLAAVCEVASGMRFSDYVKKIILDPLGMKETGYHIPENLKSRVADQYMYQTGLYKSEKIINPSCQYILTDEYDSGGAGLYTTVDDQIKLLRVLSIGGTDENGYRLLKKETIEKMEVGLLDDNGMRTYIHDRLFGYSWGLCGRVHVNPVLSDLPCSVGEFGWDGATSPLGLVDRKKEIAIYFGTHIFGGGYIYCHVHDKIKQIVYEMLGEDK